MVIGLAGRRVDATDAEPRRFTPDPANIARVRRRLHALFLAEQATALVSSAACGADLLALEVAGELGLGRRIILPCKPEEFRETSVVDRPGDWGPLFDRTVHDAAAHGDLIIIGSASDHAAYVAVNHAIVDEAIAQGERRKCPVAAVRVWEGKPRGAEDLTEEFGRYARRRGVRLLDAVDTL